MLGALVITGVSLDVSCAIMGWSDEFTPTRTPHLRCDPRAVGSRAGRSVVGITSRREEDSVSSI
jgi:hypothetical protein